LTAPGRTAAYPASESSAQGRHTPSKPCRTVVLRARRHTWRSRARPGCCRRRSRACLCFHSTTRSRRNAEGVSVSGFYHREPRTPGEINIILRRRCVACACRRRRRQARADPEIRRVARAETVWRVRVCSVASAKRDVRVRPRIYHAPKHHQIRLHPWHNSLATLSPQSRS
jgi:hypothetical protein